MPPVAVGQLVSHAVGMVLRSHAFLYLGFVRYMFRLKVQSGVGGRIQLDCVKKVMAGHGHMVGCECLGI